MEFDFDEQFPLIGIKKKCRNNCCIVSFLIFNLIVSVSILIVNLMTISSNEVSKLQNVIDYFCNTVVNCTN